MTLQGLHKVKVSNKMGPIIQTYVRQLLKTLGIVPSSMHCDLNYCVADHEHHLKCSSCFKTINSTNQGVIHLAACMTPPQPGLNAAMLCMEVVVLIYQKNTHLAMKLTF